MGTDRLRGFVLLVIAATTVHFSMAKTYEEARAGEETLSFTANLIVMLPMLVVFGLGMLVGGERFCRAVSQTNHTPTLLGYLVGGVGVGLGFALDFWFKRALEGFGYKF